jgi:hypothetical protein
MYILYVRSYTTIEIEEDEAVPLSPPHPPPTRKYLGQTADPGHGDWLGWSTRRMHLELQCGNGKGREGIALESVRGPWDRANCVQGTGHNTPPGYPGGLSRTGRVMTDDPMTGHSVIQEGCMAVPGKKGQGRTR